MCHLPVSLVRNVSGRCKNSIGSRSTSGSNITKLEQSTFHRYLWIFLLIKKAATFALCVKSYKNFFLCNMRQSNKHSKICSLVFFNIYSLPVPAAVTGLEPLILGGWDVCSTIVLVLLDAFCLVEKKWPW